jgi:hypothetical protein
MADGPSSFAMPVAARFSQLVDRFCQPFRVYRLPPLCRLPWVLPTAPSFPAATIASVFTGFGALGFFLGAVLLLPETLPEDGGPAH